MNAVKVDKETLKRRVLHLVSAGGKGVASTISSEFGISRQSANRYLSQMVADGDLQESGETRGRTYGLAIKQQDLKGFIRDGLSEDVAWREVCVPVVNGLPANVRDIWHYGMTEMINNAIDHSGGVNVSVGIRRTALHTEGWVFDDGEGIFLKIQRALELFDPRESILELAKGKLTTDPANHTGEGIFFSSKVFDGYDIRSGSLHFMHGDGMPDFLVERPKDAPGTLVVMKIANDSPRKLEDVFLQFAAPDEFTFDRTVVPVRLAQYEGEKLVSRSQAKRLTMRFERFKTVVLDFAGVESIGQAFADEVFRVFAGNHPGIELIPTHATTAVQDMVNRALAGARYGKEDDRKG